MGILFDGHFDLVRCLELLGCLTGLLGAYLLSENSARSKYGWVAFLFSNGCIATYAVLTGAPFLLLMQVGFTWTSVRGIQRWLLSRPRPGAETLPPGSCGTGRGDALQ